MKELYDKVNHEIYYGIDFYNFAHFYRIITLSSNKNIIVDNFSEDVFLTVQVISFNNIATDTGIIHDSMINNLDFSIENNNL